VRPDGNGEQDRLNRSGGLRNNQNAPLGMLICYGAGKDGKKQHRDRAKKAHDAKRHRVFRERIHKPRKRRILQPRPDERNKLADKKQPVVTMPERPERTPQQIKNGPLDGNRLKRHAAAIREMRRRDS
jgi:hypothetical protein